MSLSVLILSYNHAKYIGDAIKSVIEQREYIDNIELIVLDDGSDDGTQEIIKSFPICSEIKTKFIFKDHGGVSVISRNLNFMISESTNDYISFLSADDKYAARAFREQIDYLNGNLECDLVYGNGLNFRGESIINYTHKKDALQALRSLDPRIVETYVTSTIPSLFIQSILVRRRFFEEFQPFDNALIADDWVFNIRSFRRMIEKNRSYYFINKVVFYRRLLNESTSNNIPVHYHRVLQVARLYIPSTRLLFYKKFYKRQLKIFLKNGLFFPALRILRNLILVSMRNLDHTKNLERVVGYRKDFL